MTTRDNNVTGIMSVTGFSRSGIKAVQKVLIIEVQSFKNVYNTNNAWGLFHLIKRHVSDFKFIKMEVYENYSPVLEPGKQ